MVYKASAQVAIKSFIRHQKTFLNHRTLHTATLQRYATKPIIRKSLNSLINPEISQSALLTSANYVREELPVRLAHGIVVMQRLPYFVLTTNSLLKVYQIYCDAFTSCAQYPVIKTVDEEYGFHDMISRLVSEAGEAVELVAMGLHEAWHVSQKLVLGKEDNQQKKKHEALHNELQNWVDQQMTSRIGRRILAEQHIALHNALENGSRRGGIVDPVCNVVKCITAAAAAAKGISIARYGVAPTVRVSGKDNATLPFVRNHLEYIMFELLKNAMRATVENAKGQTLEDVRVFVAEGPSQLTIRISDAGGGLLSTQVNRVFEYGYTTARQGDLKYDGQQEFALGQVLEKQQFGVKESPMAGLGFGLPMSR